MSNVIKLVDIMNTKYMIQSLDGRLGLCLEDVLKSGATLDLDGAKFGPDCVRVLSKYYGLIPMINSTDERLDCILRENYEAYAQKIEPYDPLDLEDIDNLDKVVELINSLPKDVKYQPKFRLSNIQSKAALVLLIMARPDLEFDIRECGSDIFDFVRDLWLTSCEPHDAYLELVPPNINLVNRNEHNRFGHISYGFMLEEDFIKLKKVLPIEFGNSQIITLGEKPVPEEWKDVVAKCIDCLEAPKVVERVKGKTLKEFLTIRKD